MACFSNEEYADMVYVYGFCDGNACQARNEYYVRYPNRRLPDARVFSQVYRRLRCTGRTAHEKNENHGSSSASVALDELVLAAVRNEPSISIRRLSLRFQASTFNIWKILQINGLYPYHYTPVQGLLPADFEFRREFCRWLIENQLDDDSFISKILWTDESQFTRDGVTNFHNLHEYADTNPHLKKQNKFQQRFSVNVWAGVIGNKLIGPYRLPSTINSEYYLHFLKNELPTLLDEINLATRRDMIFQHDGAPAHHSLIVKNWLNVNYNNRWIGRNGPIHWPARSPDLTIMDFFIWGHMKELVYTTQIDSIEDLNRRIDEAASKIQEKLNNMNIKREVQKRALKCIENGGAHFEHLF